MVSSARKFRALLLAKMNFSPSRFAFPRPLGVILISLENQPLQRMRSVRFGRTIGHFWLVGIQKQLLIIQGAHKNGKASWCLWDVSFQKFARFSSNNLIGFLSLYKTLKANLDQESLSQQDILSKKNQTFEKLQTTLLPVNFELCVWILRTRDKVCWLVVCRLLGPW